LIVKSSFIGRFSTRFNDDSEVAYFLLGNPVGRLMYDKVQRASCTTARTPPTLLHTRAHILLYKFHHHVDICLFLTLSVFIILSLLLRLIAK